MKLTKWNSKIKTGKIKKMSKPADFYSKHLKNKTSIFKRFVSIFLTTASTFEPSWFVVALVYRFENLEQTNIDPSSLKVLHIKCMYTHMHIHTNTITHMLPHTCSHICTHKNPLLFVINRMFHMALWQLAHVPCLLHY